MNKRRTKPLIPPLSGRWARVGLTVLLTAFGTVGAQAQTVGGDGTQPPQDRNAELRTRTWSVYAGGGLSWAAGDVSNALISLGAIVRDALLMGASVDLADLGSFRVIAPPTMMDNEIDVTAATLKAPKIVFTPKMQMRDSAKSVELVVDNPKRRK